MESIFSLEHIFIGYQNGEQQREVLQDVNFSLNPGQQIGLYGANGSGKTSLFRCITGLLRPLQGQIKFHGQLLKTEKDFYPLRTKIGFVLQDADDQLFFPTVLEDVAFGPLNLGFSPEEARAKAVDMLAQLGLSAFENRLVHQLSGGEKRLVALADILVMQPEALLLDEPTTGLDATACERIVDILQHLSVARITISHDWHFLSQVARQFFTIQNCTLQEMPVKTDPARASRQYR